MDLFNALEKMFSFSTTMLLIYISQDKLLFWALLWVFFDFCFGVFWGVGSLICVNYFQVDIGKKIEHAH